MVRQVRDSGGESLTLLCEREIARKDQRRIEMAMGLARLPFARDLSGFDFAAQPSIDPVQMREIATGRSVGLNRWREVRLGTLPQGAAQ